ncbi:type I-E CRISPR-associated endoribonuclease Cas2, partial [Streptomyces noursei]
YAGNGRALLAYSTNSEQGYAFRTHDHKWHPVDHEGLTLIFRPSSQPSRPSPSSGWSKASKRRRFGNRAP